MTLQKKILIADDDSVTRGMLTRHLQSDCDRFEVLDAGDEYQTLNLLSLKNIDLLVIDLQIAHGDEYSLLTLIGNDHPHLPIFVISAFGTPAVRNKIEGFGTCRFFEKPLAMDLITASISQALAPPLFEGRITGLRVSSFLQILEEEKKTCCLRVHSQGRNGEITVANGNVVSAKVRNLENKEALNEIKCWKDTSIEIVNERPIPIGKGEESSPRIVPQKKRSTGKAGQTAKPQKPIPPRTAERKADPEEPAYSEHYSLTQNFISQIEKVQQPSTTIRTDQNNQPQRAAVRSSSQFARQVLTALRQEPDIVTYGIYDNQDRLHAKSSESGRLNQFKPSVYREFARSLQTEMRSGLFQYLVMKSNNIHHILFQYRKKWFFLAVNPGFKFTRFMKKITQGISA